MILLQGLDTEHIAFHSNVKRTHKSTFFFFFYLDVFRHLPRQFSSVSLFLLTVMLLVTVSLKELLSDD